MPCQGNVACSCCYVLCLKLPYSLLFTPCPEKHRLLKSITCSISFCSHHIVRACRHLWNLTQSHWTLSHWEVGYHRASIKSVSRISSLCRTRIVSFHRPAAAPCVPKRPQFEQDLLLLIMDFVSILFSTQKILPWFRMLIKGRVFWKS